MSTVRKGLSRVFVALGLSALFAAAGASAATVATFSPQGEVAQIRQLRATFSESMVPFGDLRQPDPFTLKCAEAGTGRWADDKTWIYDFKRDLPPGTKCSIAANAGLKSVAGTALTGTTTYAFNTGGPAIVRSYPESGTIEEGQDFALLLNGAVNPQSVEKLAYCTAAGITERIGVSVVTGSERDAILKAVHLTAEADRSLVVHCKQTLPHGADVAFVWAKGITTPNGVATSADRHLDFQVQADFTASFTCERENAHADCLPIRPMRIEFSAPIPRALAEKITLTASDGKHPATFEHNRGEEREGLVSFFSRGYRKSILFFGLTAGSADNDPSQAAVTAVEFPPSFPESSAIAINIPADLRDESNRPLANAALFPIQTRTALAPPIVKFASAPFGILELNAEPLLPVTVRSVENDLKISAKTVSPSPGTIRELRLSEDADIIAWYAKAKRYHEGVLPRTKVEAELGISLPAPKPKVKDKPALSYGQVDPNQDIEDVNDVETRALSLLNHQKNVDTVALPAATKTDPRPFEVVGIPLPKPGYYVIEIESAKLGAALLDAGPMFVRTTTLVTNLGVHFKLGVSNSGVWVTSLDKAKPVPDAAVQISNCNGEPVWSGKTDASGFALVDQRLPQNFYPLCENAGEAGYFVSARATDSQHRDDMAFTWSTWNQGIEPWRFALRSNPGSTDSVAVHTVFDRRLFRAGETVSMKHFIRQLNLATLQLMPQSALPATLKITHVGSGQEFNFPLHWRNRAYADNTFAIPKDAKLGEYDVSMVFADRELGTGNFRIEEFRLPVLTGGIDPPKAPLIEPTEIPVAVHVNYGNGGGAAGLAVRVSAQLQTAATPPGIAVDHFPGFSFSGPSKNPHEDNNMFREDYVGEDNDSDGDAEGASRTAPKDSILIADKIAMTLDKSGAAKLSIAKVPAITEPKELLIEATYADPNGEVQTLSQTLPVWPSAVVLGMKTDNWVSVHESLKAQVIALDTQGKPRVGQSVSVKALLHRTTTTRKRLVGGFYSYDNEFADLDLGEVCKGTADAHGLVFCDIKLEKDGQVELIASAKDDGGHAGIAASTVTVTRRGEVWFGGENDDRMDVLPEQHSYEVGQTARFQVRMPFRLATALIGIERDGILETKVVELSGTDPTIEIPIKADFAPNVFVSVLAVRGRVTEVPWYSFFVWGWKHPGDWWHAWRGEGEAYQAPTAMVDLSRPAFRYGIGEIEVGIAAHRLKVDVTTDKPSYAIRTQSKVHVQVRLPNGQVPPPGSEVAIAAVDMALLDLMPNPSWQLLSAMIEDRSYGIDTSTAQMQIIGKRHFGKKAAPAGGGGGQFPTRELFDTLLLWNARVPLDANGAADVVVPLNDSLTSFKIVAIADVIGKDNAALFGTGSTEIRATQDLQLVSGLPPVAREGDHLRAMVTVRNTTAVAMDVDLTASITGQPALAAQKVHVDGGASQEAGWDIDVPFNVHQLTWQIAGDSPSAHDRLKVGEKIVEAVPVRVLQATLMQLDKTVSIPIEAAKDAVLAPDGTPRGGIDVALRPKLTDGLSTVTDWFRQYPWPCIEQRASVAIGLRDVAQWKAVAASIPLYLDSDGLADYFPPRPGAPPQGSEVLTAYLLSASDEATRLGYDFKIPDDTRQTMQTALTRFVQGKIKRDNWVPAFIRNGGLEERKLTVLEALSRANLVKPAMLTSIDIVPNQWPTSAVIDWLLILRRTAAIPDRAKRIDEAEQILRARLNFQGTRMTFSTERDDNWWWFMANADVNSNRLLFAVIDADSWKDDAPRIVNGAVQRMDRGHWSTTVANVWGSLALEAFSKHFEKDPVTGVTRAVIDNVNTKSIDWQATPSGGVMSLNWPKPKSGAADAAGDSSLTVTQTGTGKPWLTLTARAAIPLKEALSTGFKIKKTVTPTEEKVKGKISRGDVWTVHVEVEAQADSTWVVISDPVPTGASILGNGLGRDSAIASDDNRAEGNAWLAYEERSFEAYRAYYRYVPKGAFAIDYSVRINNPGHFMVPPTHVEAMYAPEMFGENPNATVTVDP